MPEHSVGSGVLAQAQVVAGGGGEVGEGGQHLRQVHLAQAQRVRDQAHQQGAGGELPWRTGLGVQVGLDRGQQAGAVDQQLGASDGLFEGELAQACAVQGHHAGRVAHRAAPGTRVRAPAIRLAESCADRRGTCVRRSTRVPVLARPATVSSSGSGIPAASKVTSQVVLSRGGGQRR
ncbi:hypothetical protein GCM10009753_24230 [Streptantibioticus ferralitis]